MVPDALAIGQFNKSRSQIGTGLSDKCVLSYGAFPDIANDFSAKSLLMPGGAVINGDFKTCCQWISADQQQIQEFVDHARYRYPDDHQVVTRSKGLLNPGITRAMSKAAILISNSSTNRNAIRGLKPRAGADTPWKLDHWRAR